MSEEFKCDECGKTFDTERGMKVHSSQVHKNKDDSGEDKTKEEASEKTPMDVEFEVGSWKLVSGILAVLLVVTLVFAVQGMPPATEEVEGETIPKEEARDIAMDFINEYMMEGAEELEAEEVNERYGLYEVVIMVEGMMGPQEHSLYITQDGEVFFPEAVDIEEFEQMMEEQEQMIEDMEDEEGGEVVIEPDEEPEEGEEEIVIEPE